MILCGNYEVESIIVHPSNNLNETHCIEITKDNDDPVFSVTCCCNEDWVWEFMYSKTNYEVVKYLIMASIVECDTMDELIEMLDDTFEEECYDMICEGVEYYDADEECDGCCGSCMYDMDI